MNNSRKTVEDWKKAASSEDMKVIRFSMVLPENVQNLGYHARLDAETVAIDNTIAKHLGVTLSDHKEWPDEFGQITAKEWAANLPDA